MLRAAALAALAGLLTAALGHAHPRDYAVADIAVSTHGPRLSVRFLADGHRVSFDDLELVHLIRSHPSSTFSVTRGDGSWASVTLLSGNRLSGVFVPFGNAVLYEVNAEWTPEKQRGRGLVGEAANRTLEEDPDKAKFSCGSESGLRPGPDQWGKGQSTQARRLYTGIVQRGRNLLVQSWVGQCFEKDHVRRRLHMGIVVDQSFVTACTKDAVNCGSVAKAVETAVARASAVYATQMNVELYIDHLVLPSAQVPVSMAAQATSCTQLVEPGTYALQELCCCNDGLFLTDRLDSFQQWVQSLPIRSQTDVNKTGLWHLITNCHPAPGYIGRSFIGTLCHQTMACGVTSYGTTPTTALWRVMAHEIGHGFNASHTFQHGIGTTGSIMDYGNGTLWGEYQFYPEFSQAEMCSEINSQVDSCLYLQPAQPVCGDGIVSHAAGETCECPGVNVTSCAGCEKCALTLQCVAGEQCCTEQGRFSPVLSTCTDAGGDAGLCVQGFCQTTSLCGGGPACTAQPGDCSVKCADAQGQCTRVTLLPDGTPCGSDSLWQCSSGKCVAANASLAATRLDASCVDLVAPWWDADSMQYTCAWYGSSPSFCNLYGDKYRNFGWTASEACCACGGGQLAIAAGGGAPPPPAPPSPSSTSSHSPSLHVALSTKAPSSGTTTGVAPKCPLSQARIKCPALGRSRCLKETSLCTWCASTEICLAGPNSLQGCANPVQWLSKCVPG